MAKQRFRHTKQKKQQEETKTVTTHHYAKVTQKIKAFLTDAFMLLMPIMYIVFYLIMEGREDFAAHKLIGWIYIVLPLILVQTLFMMKTSQTPGYRAYDLKIIDESTGQKPHVFIILFRNMCVLLSFFTFFGWIMMFFRKDAKTLHDLLSNTAAIQYHA